MSQEYKIKKCVCVRLVYLKEKERKTRTRFVKKKRIFVLYKKGKLMYN